MPSSSRTGGSRVVRCGTPMFKPVRLHMLPLAVAAILFVTAIPIEIGMGSLRTTLPSAGDFIANLLLFLPLGAALSRHRILVVVAIAFVLSCTVELIQHWSIDRFTSPYDILANTFSGFAGALLWRLRKSRKNAADFVTLGRVAQGGLALLCVAIVATWVRPGTSSAVVGWDPSYALLLGNERTGDRSWEGVIEGVALTPEAVDGTAALQLSSVVSAQWRDVIPRATLLDTKRYTLEKGMSLHLPEEAARHFAARAAAANALTIVARVKPVSIEQSGPARILSFSWDPYHRNVDLGQERDRVVFRVRTPISGENGARFNAVSQPMLEDRTMTLVATYDGAVSRVYVDGRLAARSNLAAAGCHVRAICDGGALMAWTLIGATAVILAIAMVGVPSPSASWGMALACGALVAAVVVSLADDPRIAPAPWTAMLPFAGALTVAVAIHLATRPGSAAHSR
jgi:hypothetical protein